MRRVTPSTATVPAAARRPLGVVAVPTAARRRLGPVVAAAAAVALTTLPACDDDPFAVRWGENPDTVRLYALSRAEPNLFSGFDFHARVPVIVEGLAAAGSFDVAVDTAGGQFVWLPPGALGITSSAGLATLPGETFESAVRAPADTALYATRAPLPINAGTTYAVRTRAHAGLFGASCIYYGKLEPLAVDVGAGWVVFQFDVSPACNNRDLVPPG